jgi:hypothetical protein
MEPGSVSAFDDAQPGPRLPPQPPAGPPRLPICFARTELGDQQVRYNQPLLPLHMGRLLLLFEGPQTVEELRRMIDEPWLPEALIELERRRLLRRVAPPAPDPLASMSNFAAARRRVAEAADAANVGTPPADDEAALRRRRGQVRAMFLRQLGVLGGDMARRIDQCRSEHELGELMPQVDALIEALAGRDALGQFRQQTTRSN